MPPGGPVAEPVRNPTTQSIYFVMTDRFANGDPTNDTGGIDGDVLATGFDPANTGYYHGGDLAGLTANLPYLAELGMGAIWITSPFTNQIVQGDGTVDGSSAGYHGYWNLNWDQIDPHLGTEAEMQTLIAAAHELGIKVIFDIVVNHTGDAISYEDGSTAYIGTKSSPYLDTAGEPFDASALASSDEFPTLDATTSFPHMPTASPDAKSPAWLNDVTMYHNRGNSTFSGESDTFGDFFGLDDLFTEDPRVVDGMIELYTDVIDRYDIDGFRIDTMKHVNTEFWAEFAPAIQAAAAERGKPDFLMFGEVFNSDPIAQSGYTNLGVSSTLDFIIHDALESYVAKRGDAEVLAQAFDHDDWFTDHDNNASMQVTFFGNHDRGRSGYLVANVDPDPDQALARLELANDLLFMSRGIPVVYYGDEQGFTGDGGDRLARQDMFPTQSADYADDAQIGTEATPADDNFDTSHPLFRHIQALNALRRDHRALVTGAQVVLAADGPVFGFSRIDRDERIEYVVVTNVDPDASMISSVRTRSPNTEFVGIWGTDATVTSDESGTIEVEVGPLEAVLFQATTPIPIMVDPPSLTLARPSEGKIIPTPRYRLQADLGDRRFAEVTFAVSVDGAEPVVVGVDDAAPYRVYWNTAPYPDGATVEVIATVNDFSGRYSTDTVTVTLGER